MIYVIDFGSSKTRKIVSNIISLGFETQTIDWEKTETIDWKNLLAKEIDPDKIILSGSPTMLTEANGKLYKERFIFLKDIQIPALGICFGHQLLGLLHGSIIFKGEEMRAENKITILKKNKLFDGFEKEITMVEDHTEGITLPPGFIHLALSEKYEVEAMKHPELNIFGVQFHPEISGKNGLQLLSNFCKLI